VCCLSCSALLSGAELLGFLFYLKKIRGQSVQVRFFLVKESFSNFWGFSSCCLYTFFGCLVRNEQYSLLSVMSELLTVWCDCVLGLWLQVHGRRVSTESCRGGAVADGPCGGRR